MYEIIVLQLRDRGGTFRLIFMEFIWKFGITVNINTLYIIIFLKYIIEILMDTAEIFPVAQ